MNDAKNSNEKTQENGLSTQEVQSRLVKYGYNETPTKKESLIERIGKRFWGIVPWMLEVTAIVTLLLGKYVDTAVIVFLLLFNAVMSLWREGKAKAAMASLKKSLLIQCRVKRDGAWITIPSRELVPGDLVRVRAGDLLPADISLIEGNLGVDQSSLTGESIIVEKTTGEIAFSGSSIKRGEATGVVEAIGVKTYFGKAVSLLELAKPKLHMEEVTVKVTQRLAVIVLASLVIVFVYALVTGFQLAILLPLAGVLLVASVPVAMPTMFTLNMALGSSALAKQGVLVTRLSASEDAALMDTLCVDKTGTITMNKLFIEEKVAAKGFNGDEVVLYGALASNEANHDPIDEAFLGAATDSHISLDAYSQMAFVPFDPRTRMTEATIRRSDETFFVGKGSFDAICSSCNISEAEKASLFSEVEAFSANGLRVIAVAKGSRRKSLQFVGLAGIADRVRDDARGTLDQIRDLGISVKMLTGDSRPITRNIAQQVGLDDSVATKSDIEEAEINEKPLGSMLDGVSSIAEIYPEDKFTIVKALQGRGHVVGMTGDGVNDAAALGQAEVGIAVKNATDTAKDSASAVLTKEGLSEIVSMVKIGRTLYQRIYSWALMMISRKLHIVGYIVVMFFLTHSFMLSIMGTVLMLFLGDFVSMALSTDNVKFSSKPNKFDVSQMFKIGGSLGLVSTLEGAILTLACLSYFGLGSEVDKIYTFGFAYLNIAGFSTMLIVRARDRFWKTRPSNFLAVTVGGEFLLVILIAVFGFLELAPLGIAPVAAILGYTFLVTFLINDSIKVYFMRKFSSEKL